MKKQYIFIILIIIMLYAFFIIGKYKYKEYKVNQNISALIKGVRDIKYNIIEAGKTIEYKKSPAYINKILKSEQGLKNKGEIVIYLTPEKKYNKFTKEPINDISKKNSKQITDEESTIKYMTIFEKWLYFLFNTIKKD